MTQKSALITGAASGIGAELCNRFSRLGYRIIAMDRTPELAESAASAVGGNSLAVACDLADPLSVSDFCGHITTDWAEELEVLVCNAGIITPGDVVDLTPTAIDVQLAVMLQSPIHFMRAALPQFLKRDRGHIMATVSLGGVVAMPTSATYSAAKAGLRAFLASLNAEVRNTGVQVSGIYPSAVDTPMLREEAVSGGSPLNFLSAVQTIEQVADAYERALNNRQLEVYVPWSESLSARLAMWTPALIPRVIPLLNRIGERGRKKYLQTFNADESSPQQEP